MDSFENLEEALRRAIEHERALWMRVRGKPPGSPGCHEDLWREWLKAAQLVRVLATERMREMRPPSG